MPKIKAATVPEHRKAQRNAILEAARELILSSGTASLKFGELADRAGLARPSVYEYFKTKGDLVVALVQEELPTWSADVSAALVGSSSAEEAIATFVRTVLELVKSGRHELPFALAEGDLDADAREKIAKAHEDLFRLVAPALKILGVRDIASCLELIGGVITAAGQALRRDRGRRGLIEMAAFFAVAGVKSLASKR
jgi:AcrR family transcriptional regulator